AFAVGFVAWQASEGLARAANLSGQSRRFTGSYKARDFSGNEFPRVSWLNDSPDRVDVRLWRLRVFGSTKEELSLAYADLANVAETTATIDCTGGWNSTQIWRGVPLQDLLTSANPSDEARSVIVRSVTGYYRKFSLDAAQDFLLATHVTEDALSHGHGYPLRLVAPGRRGFEWVKWVVEVEVSETPHWWQPPLPIQ
ncbi:MAG: molybdopterin-dependent oxidoreductase, partial [Dehalococcoidia bacterium]|nr:molybdopterin-dependent oxidoreductase [Dehalococcoidia bacterium]